MLRGVLERPVSVAIATLTLVLLGFFSLLRLPVSLLPTLERPRLVVTVEAAEMSREELVRQVAQPLERRLQSLPGALEVRASVVDGECTVWLLTEWQTDVDRLRIDAERRLTAISDPRIRELEVRVEAGDAEPVLQIAVLGGESSSARAIFADKVLIPEIGRLQGAGELRRLGGASLRPVVRPRAADLAARGLTANDVVARLERIGRTQPAGRLRDGGKVRPLVVREPVTSVEELAARRLGSGAALGDVASVAMEEIPDASGFRLDGEPGVLVEVYRAPGANAVLLARAARKLIAELQLRAPSELGGGASSQLRLEMLRDASLEVTAALRQLGMAALLGLLLGTCVLRFMLGSWRSTVALAVVVPASIVAAFGGFYLWGVSLDIVSLAGLALAAGMLVDNSIVVLEAIASARGASRREPELAGTRQIALALVASFATTAVVFVPLIYLQGLARAFFGVQAFAIVTSLAVSLVLSLSLTPVLARTLAPKKETRPRSPGVEVYARILSAALARPWPTIVLALLVLVGGAALLSVLPRELIPAGSSQTAVVDVRLPPGLSHEEAHQRVASLEEALIRALPSPPLRRHTVLRRQDPLRRDLQDAHDQAEIEIELGESLGAGLDVLATRLASEPGLEAEVRVRRGAVAGALDASTRRLEIELTAASPARVERLAKNLAEGLRSDEEIETRRLAGDQGRSRKPSPAFAIDWDTWRLTQLGSDAGSLGRQVRSALGGFYAGRVDIAGAEPEILVEATLPDDLRTLPVRPSEADEVAPTVVPLASVAEIERRFQPPALERASGRPVARLGVDGRVPQGRLERILEGWPLGLDERARLSGQAAEIQRSFSQLRLALALALVLVFLTVAALYESLAMPLVVMITVPVAAAGAVAALWLGGESLNVMSFLGLILLAGIVVNNAIVLVHRIEQLTVRLAATEAVLQAARERYRPILMTTLTTLLGMVPLALLAGEGQEMRRALALAVSGGLVTSFWAALFVVPVLHRALVRREGAG